MIGSGNSSNTISKKLVDKLKLPVEEHPQPYRVGWIKGVEPVEMTPRCLVLFSINKHINEIFV